MSPLSKPDLAAVLEHYGADLSRVPYAGWQSIRCPFHDDQMASAGVNLDRQRFRCFACGVSGDSIQLIKEAEGLGFKDALEWAKAKLGHNGSDVREATGGSGERYRPFGEDEGD